MGLAHRVIPTMLMSGRKLMKGKRFDAWRSVGLVAQAVRIHQARVVDELVLLDIDATKQGRGPDLALVEELSAEVFAPLAVGGGVRSVADVKALLRAGADKVVIGTGVVEVPDLVRKCADAVGSQAIVVSVDVGYGDSVMVRCGKEGYSHDALDYAGWAERAGAGEILLQAIERDGTMEGYDLELIGKVSAAVGVPVIASGGCSGYEDMRQALDAGASAAAVGALFQFTDATPRGAAQYLARQGIEVRV
jgi:cyclase